VKPVGKPDAGNPHVRFDERGWETGRPIRVSARAQPRLYRNRGKQRFLRRPTAEVLRLQSLISKVRM